MKLLPTALAFLSTGLLCAADFAGKWSGSFESKNPDGENRSRPAFMLLKQEGDKVTGQAGPDENELHALNNCKATGNKLRCEVDAGEPLAFEVELNGDSLSGTLTGPTQDGGTRTAKLNLKRVPAK